MWFMKQLIRLLGGVFQVRLMKSARKCGQADPLSV